MDSRRQSAAEVTQSLTTFKENRLPPNHVIVGAGPQQPEERSMPRSTANNDYDYDYDAFNGTFRHNQHAPKKMDNTSGTHRSSTPHQTPANYDSLALEEIPWTPIVVGSDEPSSFSNGSGWMSQPGARYPLDIVIGLSRLANVYKVIVEVNNYYFPSSIEICVGRGLPGDKADYDGAKRAKYGAKGEMHFKKREDENGSKVGIDRIVVLGYPMKEADGLPLDSRREQRTTRASSADRKTRATSAGRTSRAVARTPAPAPPPPRPAPSPLPPQPMAFHSQGSGMITTSNGLAGDPLSSLRIVKKVLGDKRQSAMERGMEVEANVCLRAIQRLDEYEVRLVDLSKRNADALIHKDEIEVNHISFAMAECRDTVFRAIHVDLLLSKSELRSIGVASSWAS